MDHKTKEALVADLNGDVENVGDPSNLMAALDAPRWTWVFDDHAGYDCMTAGYMIHEDGKHRFTIDVADMGVSASDMERCHEEHHEAERLARLVCARLNG